MIVFKKAVYSSRILPRSLDARRAVQRTLFLTACVTCLMMGAFSANVGAQPQASTQIAADDAPSRGASNVSPDVAQKAAAIARQTMSPFCPGRTLSDCPSEYATQWRKDIRAMVQSGMSAAAIQKELEGRIGENLSGSPHRESSYGVSIGLALGAALVLFFVLSKLRSNAQEKSRDKEAHVAEVDDSRLNQELEMAESDED